jgi:hypothetical protein
MVPIVRSPSTCSEVAVGFEANEGRKPVQGSIYTFAGKLLVGQVIKFNQGLSVSHNNLHKHAESGDGDPNS